MYYFIEHTCQSQSTPVSVNGLDFFVPFLTLLPKCVERLSKNTTDVNTWCYARDNQKWVLKLSVQCPRGNNLKI